MSGGALGWLVAATAAFVAAATSLRLHVASGGVWTVLGALALYGAGNVMILHPMRAGGMAVALSASAALQLVLVNLIAITVFGERPRPAQLAGIGLGMLAVVLIGWPSRSGE